MSEGKASLGQMFAAGKKSRGLWTVAAIVAALSLTYGLYFRGRVRDLKAQQIRLIGSGTEYLERTLETALGNVYNLGQDLSTLSEFIDRQPFLRLTSRMELASEAVATSETSATFGQRQGQISIELSKLTIRSLERTVRLEGSAILLGDLAGLPETTASNNGGKLVVRNVEEAVSLAIEDIQAGFDSIPPGQKLKVDIELPEDTAGAREIVLSRKSTATIRPSWRKIIPTLIGEIESGEWSEKDLTFTAKETIQLGAVGAEWLARLPLGSLALKKHCAPYVAIAPRGPPLFPLNREQAGLLGDSKLPLEAKVSLGATSIKFMSGQESQRAALDEEQQSSLGSNRKIEIVKHCAPALIAGSEANAEAFWLATTGDQALEAVTTRLISISSDGYQAQMEGDVPSNRLIVLRTHEIPFAERLDGRTVTWRKHGLEITLPIQESRPVQVTKGQYATLEALSSPDIWAPTFELVKQETDGWRLEATGRRLRDSLTFDREIAGAELRQPRLGSRKEAGELILALEPNDSSAAVRFEVNFAPILAGLPLGHQFVSYFVARADGSVVYTQRDAGNPDLHLRSLTQLKELSELENRAGSAKEGQKLFGLETVRTQELGFALLCQPVRVPHSRTGVGTSSESLELRLCGLINQNEEQKAALAVAPQMAGLMTVLTLLGGLSWPFLRFLFLDRGERLRRFDVLFLIAGTFCSLLFLTSLITLGHRMVDLDGQMKLQLEDLAQQVDHRLQQDLRVAGAQLRTFDQELCAQESPIGWISGPRLSELFKRSGVREQAGFELPPPLQFPFMTSVFWLDSDGMQIAKATVHKRNTPRISVREREYFRSHIEQRAWLLDKQEVYFETFRSATTGQLSAALSTSSLSWSGDGEECVSKMPTPRVAVLEALPPSVASPVVTPPFGFAVIDEMGQVKFHSDPRYVGFDNLLDQLSRPDRLIAVLRSNAPAALSTSYMGRPHQFHIARRDTLPWRVATYYDRELSATLALEAFVIGLLPLLIYGLLMTIVLYYFRAALLRFLWPVEAWNVAYTRLLFVYCGLGGALLLCRYLDAIPVSVAILAATLLPLLGLLYTVLRLRKEQVPETSVPSVPRSYLLGFVLLWVLVAVLPALVLIDAAWRLEIVQLQSYQEKNEATLLQARKQRLMKQHLRLPPEILDDRLELVSDIYRVPTGESWLRRRPVNGMKWLPRATSFLPIYNTSSRDLRYLGYWRAADAGAEDSTHVRSIPSLRTWGHGGHYFLLSILFLTLVYFLKCWVEYTARKLCFSRVTNRRGVQAAELVKQAATKSLVGILSTAPQIEEIRSQWLGLRWNLDGSDAPLTESNVAVLIEGFDNQTEIETTRLTKLGRLESFLEQESGGALLLAWSDPGERVTELLANKSGEEEQRATAELSRWRRVLSQFPARVVILDQEQSIEDYHRLWTRISERERRALVQVADEGVLNPRQDQVAERLWHRGLLTQGTALKLRSDELEKFLRENETVDEVRQNDLAARETGWRRWRMLLGVPLAALVAFLIVTQQGLLINSIAVLTGAGGALAVAFRYAGIFKSGGQG